MNRSHEVGTAAALFVVLCLLSLCLCLSACGSHEPSGPVDAQASRATASPRSTPPANSGQGAGGTDSDSSKAKDQEEVADQNDNEEDSDAETKYFHGYRCIDDCSGHEAGYKWAEEHDIDDVDQCGGNSQSFI